MQIFCMELNKHIRGEFAMKDINGVTLQIDDKVAYVHGKNSDASLKTGTKTFSSERFGLKLNANTSP